MDCFGRVRRDDLLGRFFPDGVNEAHRAHVTAWWSEVLGGPARYTGELGGYEGILAHHPGAHRQVLPFALGIGKAQIDPFDLFFLDPFDDVLCLGHF
jgi:hypothetical protein